MKEGGGLEVDDSFKPNIEVCDKLSGRGRNKGRYRPHEGTHFVDFGEPIQAGDLGVRYKNSFLRWFLI